MNDFLIFGSTGLTGGYFLDEVKNRNKKYHLFTRKLIKDGSEYYGPYTNYKTINILLDLINNLYPLRISNYNLSEKQINSKNEKLSLRILKKAGNTLILGFQIGSSVDMNESLISEKEYDSNIRSVKQILKGKFSPSKDLLKEKMYNYSKNMLSLIHI